MQTESDNYDIATLPLNKFGSIDDFESFAQNTLSRNTRHYFNDGMMKQRTLADNKASFSRYRILPRHLVNVSGFTSGVTVLGEQAAFPIGISPMAFQKLATPEGDKASARAAATRNIVFIQSAASSFSMEDVARAAGGGGGTRWQQMYLWSHRSFTLELVRRAEAAGNKALVVGVDKPVSGTRYNSRRGIVKLPPGWKQWAPNFMNNSVKPEWKMLNPSQTWSELAWLRTQTRLPIVIKGLLNAKDIQRAADIGVKGILVSNHGGR